MPKLEITTLIGCPLDCTFCPQSNLNSAWKNNEGGSRLLDFKTFKNAVDKLPSNVDIVFSGYSEPFANPKMPEFLEYAAKLPNRIYLYTTLQGLNPNYRNNLKKLIKEKRIIRTVVHLPDDHENMPGWKLNKTNIKNIGVIASLKEVNTMTMSETNLVNKKLLQSLWDNGFKKLSFKLRLKRYLDANRFIGWTRAGNLTKEDFAEGELLDEKAWSEPISCKQTPFYDENVLLPNGDVTICCMDYSLKHVIGNLNNDSYSDIRSSKELANIASINSGLKEGNTLCQSCDNVTCHHYDINTQQYISYSPGHLENLIPNFFSQSTKRKLVTKIRNIRSIFS